MIFTTKAEYGVRLLVELGRHGADHPVSLKAIAEAEGLPLAYLERIVALLGEHDPGAPVLPYLMSGGTDNKALSELGIRGYGFAPLQLPTGLDFPAMFHGVDERVPLTALDFGTRVLTDLLLTY